MDWINITQAPRLVQACPPPKLGEWIYRAMVDAEGFVWVVEFTNPAQDQARRAIRLPKAQP